MSLLSSSRVSSPPSVPSVGSLHCGVLDVYRDADKPTKRLFKRVYNTLWRYLWPINRLDAISHVYKLSEVLSKQPPYLTPAYFAALSQLWLLTSGGSGGIDSRNMTPEDCVYHPKLKTLGLIYRSRFFPSRPHYPVAGSKKVVISFTSYGVDYYQRVCNLVNRAVRDDILACQVGMKQRGQPFG